MKRFGEVLKGGDLYRRQTVSDITELAQTYKQAPWRKQMQFIGLFALVLVIIALIAGMYLSVSARTTAAGRDIQEMERQINGMDQEIEDLQAKLAYLNSAGEMSRRAREKGFRPLPADQVVYLPVQGYIDRQPAVLASYTRHPLVSAAAIPPQYTESLFDWLARLIAGNRKQAWSLPEFQLIHSFAIQRIAAVQSTAYIVSPEVQVQP
jgi:cell division protein FtsL